MSETYAGRATGRLAGAVYEAPAASTLRDAVNFPMWVKVLFVGGIIVFLASMVGLMLSPVLGNSTSVVVLWGTAAAGIGALWIVATVAPRYYAKR